MNNIIVFIFARTVVVMLRGFMAMPLELGVHMPGSPKHFGYIGFIMIELKANYCD